MNYELTKHAQTVVLERRIAVEWIERALASPEAVRPDETDPALEHRLCRIPEHGQRVLRVIVARTATPLRVVSAYFDRRMRGRL
jgi:hypothetical protein